MIFEEENIYSNLVEGGDVGSRGVLLSYGDSDGLIPVGVFVLRCFVTPDGKITDVFKAQDANGYAILDEVVFEHGDISKKDPGNTIVVPANSYDEVFEMRSSNNQEFKELTGYRKADAYSVEAVNKVVANYLAHQPENTELKIAPLAGVTLEDVGAVLLNEDNKERGKNYTMFPFDPAKILEKILEKHYEVEEQNTRGR